MVEQDDEEGGAAPPAESSQAISAVAAPPARQDDESVESGEPNQGFRAVHATTGADTLARPIAGERALGPDPVIESADDAARRGRAAQVSATQTSPEAVVAFEANYAFGIQSYDESFTINSADGALLGACGMGINESLDRAAADTDQVRLLEIWLYDRSAVRRREPAPCLSRL